MELTITTPTVLFPAVSLLLLAYTNRFLHLSALVRKLHSDWLTGKDPVLRAQVRNLKWRIDLTRWCQAFGVMSLLGCLCSLLLLMTTVEVIGVVIFAVSVLLMAISLILALWEILISGKALELYLDQMSDRADSSAV
jgi:Protein of unknown function (DUF2721)